MRHICIALFALYYDVLPKKDTHRSKIPNMRIKIKGLRALGIFKTQVFKIQGNNYYEGKHIHII